MGTVIKLSPKELELAEDAVGYMRDLSGDELDELGIPRDARMPSIAPLGGMQMWLVLTGCGNEVIADLLYRVGDMAEGVAEQACDLKPSQVAAIRRTSRGLVERIEEATGITA